ncbi:MAG: aminotransferase DegT [Bacteroidetes bacterium HGW-Bacteroidetes-8]|jgi:aminotransferase in exopolysaccharide biosynthesis|nr:MAG: aminotransferase DegT [Bacteroidetes bacterium HGW-Bacteroidetes-8]
MEPKFNDIIKFIREKYNTPEGFIPLHSPFFGGNEKKYLEECIDSSFVSSVGKFVDLFEEKIAEYTGAKKAVACVNGTNALQIALILVGVERDTEVITQPLTFIATANAIRYCGANPVFLDVDLDTLGLSPMALKNWLSNNVELRKIILNDIHTNYQNKSQLQPLNIKTGKRITACVPMHTFGHPARIDEIIKICNDYNIPVVEDAAESLGSYYKGQHTGTFGKIGVLSFNGNKILTTGGGGMLLFMDEILAKKAKHLTTQAKLPHPWEFAHDEIGYNYRMPNINAALGLAQLEQLPQFLKSKRKIASFYCDFFDSLSMIFIKEPPNSSSNYWLNSILLQNHEERDEFLKIMNENEIMTRPVWNLMNTLDMFRFYETDQLVNSYNIAEKLVNLPSSPIIK